MVRRIVVKGRVQGVGYRYFVARLAAEYGITGEVWNRSDGAVEVLAAHPNPTQMAAFETALWTGPGLVKGVSGVRDEGTFEGFIIGPTQSV